MSKKIYILISVVLVAAVVLVFTKKDAAPLPEGKLITGSATETFSGTITAVDTGCFYDAVCSVSVDGKKVVLVKGGRGMSPDIKVGKLLGVESIGDLEQKIGSHANVYATTTPDGEWSLYGDEKYYVEVVTLK